jgi:alkane 1-monooxygenase
MFMLQRHSDHHAHPARPYQQLQSAPEAPQLPAGFAGMLLLALLPPLWRRVMDPLARQAMGEPVAAEPADVAEALPARGFADMSVSNSR